MLAKGLSIHTKHHCHWCIGDARSRSEWGLSEYKGGLTGIPIIKIRRSHNLLIFIMRIPLHYTVPGQVRPKSLTELWIIDAVWHQRTWSTLVQVISCCPTAPSHYQNQYWLIISEVLQNSPGGNFTSSTHATTLYNEFENYTFHLELLARHHPGAEKLRGTYWPSNSGQCAVVPGGAYFNFLGGIHVGKSYKFILTHWGQDKMAAIFQTTFSNRFSWMKMCEFRWTFHWSLFLGVQLTIFQNWFR